MFLNPTVGNDDDLVITKTVTNLQQNPADLIFLDSDDENDCRCESNDNNKKPRKNKKVIVNKKTGGRVKVEKDWSTSHIEMQAGRETRAKKKEERARELREATEATTAACAVANERAPAIQAHSDKKMSLLQNPLQFLATKLHVLMDFLLVTTVSTCIATPQPPLPSTSAPVAPFVEHQSEETPDC